MVFVTESLPKTYPFPAANSAALPDRIFSVYIIRQHFFLFVTGKIRSCLPYVLPFIYISLELLFYYYPDSLSLFCSWKQMEMDKKEIFS